MTFNYPHEEIGKEVGDVLEQIVQLKDKISSPYSVKFPLKSRKDREDSLRFWSGCFVGNSDNLFGFLRLGGINLKLI